MNQKYYYSLATCAFIFGFFYWAFAHDIIVINWEKKQHIEDQTLSTLRIARNTVALYFWRNNRWNQESKEILWPCHPAEQAKHVTTAWLGLIDEENILETRVCLQTSLTNPAGTQLYLSFDRPILGQNMATFDKLMIIEGLFKTLRDNQVPIQAVWFLVKHQPMIDAHLDFSHPWPITGFIDLQK